MSDADDFVAAGLYDPDSAGASNRLELLRFLTDEVGASIPEIVQAEEEDRLLTMSAFRAIQPDGPRMTLAEAAERAGVSPEFARSVWRAAGFPDPRPFERKFGTADISMLDLVRIGCEFMDERAVMQLVRTLGNSASQIAESEIALVRSNMEAPLLEAGDFVTIARTYRELVSSLFPRVVETIDTLHRHRIDAIARRYIGSRPSAANVAPLAVGFADLSGYTGLAAKLDSVALSEMLTRFETTTGDIIASAGADVAKRIGDAVMFVTNAPGIACTLSLDLIEACTRAGLPKLRIGVSFGDVLVRYGDFYGPVVNLASRLVNAAEPGTVLTDESLAARLAGVGGGRYAFVAAGRLDLRGFGDTVPAFQILRP
jgi:adenylate cyclase